MKDFLSNSLTQLRKGTLEYSVLLIIRRQEVYAAEMISQLRALKQPIHEGTLYPLLSRLKREGLLQYRWEESTSGPPRKYYSLTNQGHEIVNSLSEYWKELQQALTNFTQS